MSYSPDQSTVVNRPPAPPDAAGGPPGPPDDPGSRGGFGMLLTIVLLAVAAAVLGALLLTREHGNRHRPARSAVAGTTHSTATLPRANTTTAAQTTTEAATTAPTTTEATTTQPARIAVPSLPGDPQAALQTVRDAGLSANVRYVPSDEPRGPVVAQYPAAGASATAGSQVTINVSSGKSSDEVAVPNTIGM